MRIEPAPGLGRDMEGFAALPAESGEQLFTVTITVPVRGVKKIHAQVEGTVQSCKRLFIFDISPRSANRPRAKTDRRNLPACPSKFTILHDASSEVISILYFIRYLLKLWDTLNIKHLPEYHP